MFQALLRGIVQQAAPKIKPGAVAGAVPALFIGIPFELAAQMRTTDGDDETLPLLVLVNAHLLSVALHHAAMSRGKRLQLGAGRREKASCKPLAFTTSSSPIPKV